MISVSEARTLIHNENEHFRTVKLPLLQANGYVLAEALISPLDTPPFNQSAMDGYAFAYDSLEHSKELKVKTSIQAGSSFEGSLAPGETARIFTGAPLPKGADTVVMQEKISRNADKISIEDNAVIKGLNVRLKGSQTARGETALKQGQLLTPAAISFLAGLGIFEVTVFDKPKINLLITGDELTPPGQILEAGQIYESNSFGLIAALKQMGIEPEYVMYADDNQIQLNTAIKKGLQADILIITGGVSVGDYDFVTSGLETCGVKTVFHKVKQKPGKPLFFGKKNKTLVFGLPGNPASVMTCFYEYVQAAIFQFCQLEKSQDMLYPLAAEYRKKPGLTHFLKGQIHGHNVFILPGQESYLMNSYALADCLIEIGEEKTLCEKGELVRVRKL